MRLVIIYAVKHLEDATIAQLIVSQYHCFNHLGSWKKSATEFSRLLEKIQYFLRLVPLILNMSNSTTDWLDTGDNAWQLTAASLVALQSVPGLLVL